MTGSGVTKDLQREKKKTFFPTFIKKNMRQRPEENAFNQLSTMNIPRTRAYIKQGANDSKESLKCALHSPVKNEVPSLEISK